ncbi:MAG: NADH-quinone oxidoreductase subunit J [Pseudomonadota bacterium]|nr:NADH-quinone oxidoreductase subunit J [Pseudomonadota bacterium]MEC8154133.1 NADH-quinone oxidoreductase subunit J [Pseudomonadota bacterium]
MITGLAFYLFAAATIASALMVVTSRNAVHSVLFLILAFFSASALFVLRGAEFVAMILVIVYVGAVAVLFLFVVMMLHVGENRLFQGVKRFGVVGVLVGLAVLAELVLVVITRAFRPENPAPATNPQPEGVNVTEALGQILYTDYFLLFQMSGLVLLVAMIGAITLTLRSRDGVKRQSIPQQIERSREEAVALRKVESGKGIG